MQSAKETVANVAASAKAGMEKTKATVQEKAEKMTTRDPLRKEMATEKKEQRIHEAERQKHEVREHNAATKHTTAGGGTFGHHNTTTAGGYSTGTTGAEGPLRGDHTAGGVFGSEYPTGPTAGTGRVAHQDPNARTGYGSGNTF